MTTASERLGHIPGPSLASVATTVGVVAVGAALFEAALVPGIVLGAAALFAPKLAARRLPNVQRGLRTFVQWSAARPIVPHPGAAAALLPRIQAKQALAKTVTFRITVAALDFTWTYIFLGEIATAAGLSALNLVAGPVFYFLHEAAWNIYAPQTGATQTGATQTGAPQSVAVVGTAGLKVARSLAKTIVYETLGTVAEFTVNYAVVGNVTTAAILTAPFAVLGPFIYLGHEKAWESFTARARQALPTALSSAS